MRPLGKESQNFEDHTGDTRMQQYLHNILLKLNPVYAARHVRDVMIDKGLIKVPGTDEMLARIRTELNIKHNTEDLMNPDVLFKSGYEGLENKNTETKRGSPPNYGLSPEEMDVILRRSKNKK